jgi:hypothetical protein
LQVPNAPTIGTATAAGLSASVTFTAPSNVGGSAITGYTVISSPGSITATGASSPITVSGLTSGTSYTFTVVATNTYGSGPASAASNSITAVNPDAFIEKLFSTWLYTGNDSTQTITNGINLTGNSGLVWTKVRNNSDSHWLVDTVRGANNNIETNSTNQQRTFIGVTGFTSSGYTLQEDANIQINDARFNYVSWTFREQAKFFDIVTFTSSASGNKTFSHNLGSTPGCVFVKNTQTGDPWLVYHRSVGDNAYLSLNSTAAQDPFTGAFSATSTTFTIASGLMYNSQTYVAYLFAHDAGGFGVTGSENVISCGSYVGDGTTNGSKKITLGYEPQFIIMKPAQAAPSGFNGWNMLDTMRGIPTGGYDPLLSANSGGSEDTTNDLYSVEADGFRHTYAGTAGNDDGITYLYIAIRRGPMALPTVGTQVYSGVLRTGTGVAANVTGAGFPPDLVILEQRIDPKGSFSDRLRGTTQILQSYETAVESTDANGVTSFSMDGMAVGSGFVANRSSRAYVYWFFRRYPSVFDEVCYSGNSASSGTGNTQLLNHNLTVPPEMIIVKRRSGASDWVIWTSALSATQYMFLDSGAVLSANPTFFFGTTGPTPSATQFKVGDAYYTNATGSTYVAYLFATVAGVSKVGSYTGTGALQTVNCGFTTGARWVMVKRTDSTGDWYVWDSARGITSGNDPYLLLNANVGEVTGTNYVDTTAAGFQVTAAAPAEINASGGTYIFLAIA